MMSGIVPPSRVTPPTGSQVTLNFDYSRGSYAPRPDTMSSMANFAKKNVKWIAIGTFLLGALYFLWSFFMRKPPSPPTNGTKPERRFQPPPSTVRIAHKEERDPQVIIGKKTIEVDPVVLQQYLMLYVVVTKKHLALLTSALSGLMNKVGSSKSFKDRITETANPREDRVAAFRELIESFIETYGTDLEEYKIGNQKLPKGYYTKESGEYPIVTAFEELMQT